MGRSVRVDHAGAFYHITSRGNERKKIFVTYKDRKKFLGKLGDTFVLTDRDACSQVKDKNLTHRAPS